MKSLRTSPDNGDNEDSDVASEPPSKTDSVSELWEEALNSASDIFWVFFNDSIESVTFFSPGLQRGALAITDLEVPILVSSGKSSLTQVGDTSRSECGGSSLSNPKETMTSLADVGAISLKRNINN